MPTARWAFSISVGHMKQGDIHSLIDAFALGISTAKGDRLVDVLGNVRLTIETLARQPEMIIRSACELLPVLVATAARDNTDPMLRGTIAEILATFGPAVEHVVDEATNLELFDSKDLAAVRLMLLDGYRLCLSQPTSIIGRKAILEALRYAKPVDEARALVQRSLADPLSSVVAKANESLAAMNSKHRV
jgi:hypothetical protein